ncbi:MAG: hypothetical protein V2B19_29990 [Pseudomonadota bacterium]
MTDTHRLRRVSIHPSRATRFYSPVIHHGEILLGSAPEVSARSDKHRFQQPMLPGTDNPYRYGTGVMARLFITMAKLEKLFTR